MGDPTGVRIRFGLILMRTQCAAARPLLRPANTSRGRTLFSLHNYRGVSDVFGSAPLHASLNSKRVQFSNVHLSRELREHVQVDTENHY